MDVVYDRDGKILHLQTAKGFSTKLFVGYHLCLFDALGDYGTGHDKEDKAGHDRIPWPRPMIEHSTDKSLSVWKSERKKPSRPRQTRVLIWLENLDYIVVLAERPRAMILVTAYCTDIKSHKEKLRKERDEYYKMQKPPDGAT